MSTTNERNKTTYCNREDISEDASIVQNGMQGSAEQSYQVAVGLHVLWQYNQFVDEVSSASKSKYSSYDQYT